MSIASSAAAPSADKFEGIIDPYGRLLDKPELGIILNKSVRSIDRLRKRRVIPFLILGGEVRFRLRDVEKALERYTIRELQL